MTSSPIAGFGLGLITALGAFTAYLHRELKSERTRLRDDLETERQERALEVQSLLARIATFQPNREDGGAALALTEPSPSPTLPPIEDPEPYISDYPMDDERWEAYVEATRKNTVTVDDHAEPSPVPVT